jgi:hypothetical protein
MPASQPLAQIVQKRKYKKCPTYHRLDLYNRTSVAPTSVRSRASQASTIQVCNTAAAAKRHEPFRATLGRAGQSVRWSVIELQAAWRSTVDVRICDQSEWSESPSAGVWGWVILISMWWVCGCVCVCVGVTTFTVVATVYVRQPIREGITGANGCGESGVGGLHDLPSSSDISGRVWIWLRVSQSGILAERCHYPVYHEGRQLD